MSMTRSWAAGVEIIGIRDAGYRTIETLRLEKGYLYWSADITPGLYTH